MLTTLLQTQKAHLHKLKKQLKLRLLRLILLLLLNNQNKQDKNEACPKGMRLIFLSKFLGIPYAGKRWRHSLQLRQRRTLLRSNLRQAHCSRNSKIKTLANLLPAMSPSVCEAIGGVRAGRGADIIRQNYFPHKDDSKHQPLPANVFPCVSTSVV